MTKSYQDEKSSLLAHSEAMFFSQTVVEASRYDQEINVEPVEWGKVESGQIRIRLFNIELSYVYLLYMYVTYMNL